MYTHKHWIYLNHSRTGEDKGDFLSSEGQHSSPEYKFEFRQALKAAIDAHGDTQSTLWRYICQELPNFGRSTLSHWLSGRMEPSTKRSVEALYMIEARYGLNRGYFRSKIPTHANGREKPNTNLTRYHFDLARWHLPDDFNRQPLASQKEIISWIKSNVLPGATDASRYQRTMVASRYALKFRSLNHDGPEGAEDIFASPELEAEMMDLLRFKTGSFTPFGLSRKASWKPSTAFVCGYRFAYLFGAATKQANNSGLGIEPSKLSFAMLVFPGYWEWYLNWRRDRRGFFTSTEVQLLSSAISLLQPRTGWISQRPDLAEKTFSFAQIVTPSETTFSKSNWAEQCDKILRHLRQLRTDVKQLAIPNKDPFEPISVILDSDNPIGEYCKIADEILRLMPNVAQYPVAAAESIRDFLMIRIALHTGLRQKNLRELLVAEEGINRPEGVLRRLGRGELRWQDGAWKVWLPPEAFKNGSSSFFRKSPWEIVLPSVQNLYPIIESYLKTYRNILLKGNDGMGMFFVKEASRSSAHPEYSQQTFYDCWASIIRRYGIYNPYTNRGAIKGLRQHGPHCIRHVLATHVLKETGSLELAGYAIQDTAETIASHYGRFLPRDKAKLVARTMTEAFSAD